MEVQAKLTNLRITPRKSRQVADLIRGKKLRQARVILEFTVKKSSEPILKLLNSAAASARHNFQMDDSNLYISKITVDEGPKLKRMMPVSRGRGHLILKRTSHIKLTLSEINEKNKSSV